MVLSHGFVTRLRICCRSTIRGVHYTKHLLPDGKVAFHSSIFTVLSSLAQHNFIVPFLFGRSQRQTLWHRFFFFVAFIVMSYVAFYPPVSWGAVPGGRSLGGGPWGNVRPHFLRPPTRPQPWPASSLPTVALSLNTTTALRSWGTRRGVGGLY